jgi:fermentation-respiration switch protein FrsA (DUF1100 family)
MATRRWSIDSSPTERLPETPSRLLTGISPRQDDQVSALARLSTGGCAMTQPHRYQFDVNGTRLVGNLFAPPHGRPRACAVLTGPLTSVKEQATGAYAAALAERGYLALAFDHRTFGESGGKPRQFENPFAKIEDIRAAATALLADPGPPDMGLIGVGVCAGAGYMARAVAEDGRFRGFAAVAGYFGEATPATLAAASSAIERGRAAEEKWRQTGVADTIAAVSADGRNVAMPLREAYEYYGTSRGAVPNYVNAFAVQSQAYTATFDSLGAAALIKVPTFVVHAEKALAPALARRFITNLSGPRQDLWLTSRGQIDFYDDAALIGAAAEAMVSYFARNLPSLNP